MSLFLVPNVKNILANIWMRILPILMYQNMKIQCYTNLDNYFKIQIIFAVHVSKHNRR